MYIWDLVFQGDSRGICFFTHGCNDNFLSMMFTLLCKYRIPNFLLTDPPNSSGKRKRNANKFMLKRQSQKKKQMHIMHPSQKSSEQEHHFEYRTTSCRLKQPTSQCKIVGVVIFNVLGDPEDDRARSRIT